MIKNWFVRAFSSICAPCTSRDDKTVKVQDLGESKQESVKNSPSMLLLDDYSYMAGAET
jgi:hypothetical protein